MLPRVKSRLLNKSMTAVGVQTDGLGLDRSFGTLDRTAVMRSFVENLPRLCLKSPAIFPEVQASHNQEFLQANYPDVLLLESWLTEMVERITVNKKQELFSKGFLGDTLLTYKLESTIQDVDVHRMWAKVKQMDWVKRENLYKAGVTAANVERLYRAFYQYAVGFPSVVQQIVQESPETSEIAIHCLSVFTALYFEIVKTMHGDHVAVKCLDRHQEGVFDKMQAYEESLQTCAKQLAESEQRVNDLEDSLSDAMVSGDAARLEAGKLRDSKLAMMQQLQKTTLAHQAKLDEQELRVQDLLMLLKSAREKTDDASVEMANVKQIHTNEQKLWAEQIDAAAQEKTDINRRMASVSVELAALHLNLWKPKDGTVKSRPSLINTAEIVNSFAVTVQRIRGSAAQERREVDFECTQSEKDKEEKLAKMRDIVTQTESREQGILKEIQVLKASLKASMATADGLQNDLGSAHLRMARQISMTRYSRKVGRRLLLRHIAEVTVLRRRARGRCLERATSSESIKGVTIEKSVSIASVEDLTPELETAQRQLEEEWARHKKAEVERAVELQALLDATRAKFGALSARLDESQRGALQKEELQQSLELSQQRVRDVQEQMARNESVREGEISRRDEHIERLKESIKQKQDAHNETSAQLRKLRAGHVVHHAKGNLTRSRLEKHLSDANTRLTSVELHDKDATAKLTSQSKTLANAESELSRARMFIAKQTKEFAAVKEGATVQLKGLETKMEHARDRASVAEKVLEEYRGNTEPQLEALKLSNDKLEEKVDNNARLIERLEDDLVTQVDEISELEAILQRERDQNAHNENAVSRLEREKVSFFETVQNATQKAEQQQGNKQELEELYEFAQQQIVELLARIQNLENQILAFGEMIMSSEEEEESEEESESESDVDEITIIKKAKKKKERKLRMIRAVPTAESGMQTTEATHFELQPLEEALRLQNAAGERAARRLVEATDRLKEAEEQHRKHVKNAESRSATGEAQVQAVKPSVVLPPDLAALMQAPVPAQVRIMSRRACCRLVYQVYAAKLRHEAARHGAPRGLPEFVYQFFHLKYGAGGRAELRVCEFLASVLRYQDSDTMRLFGGFVGVRLERHKDQASALRFFLYLLACLAVDDDIAERGGARAAPVLNEDAEDVVLIQRGSALQLLRTAFEGEGRTALWEELGARVAAEGREQLDRAWVLRAALGLWYAEEARGADAAALLFASGSDDGRGL
jgi:hypothetical protein